jgi:hypothetical protein
MNLIDYCYRNYKFRQLTHFLFVLVKCHIVNREELDPAS